MYCPECGNIYLEMGIAIDPKYINDGRTIVPINRTLKPEEVELIHCIKCPKCGWSDDGKWFSN